MIHKLFKYLHKESIDYTIINGYKSLFEKTNTSEDVDILFKKEDFLKIEHILKGFCKLNDFKIVQIYHQEVYAKNIFIFDPNTTKILNLDTYGKLQRKHTAFFTETEIFKNFSTYKGINILATHQEFLHYLLKKIDKNEITDTVFNYLQMLFFKEEALCKKMLKQCFKNHSDSVIKALQSKNKSKLLESIETLRKDIVSNPKIPLNDRFKDKLRILKRIIKPTGITISFLGPDGSGKSTIIDGLTHKTLPFRKTTYFHLKPIITNNKSIATVNPHECAPYSKLKSYVKLLFFVYQYNLGWLKNIYLLKIKSTLVIFDRYYDDLIVDKKRYRYGGSKRVAKLIRFFIRKPELYFILTTNADVIYNRKQEVEFSELQAQIKNYKALTNGKQYYHIDVNRSPDSIVKDVYSILMKKMNERY
ncbi:hypothetical protein [Flavivirga jejuensis]|uniref:Thymidylate kinase n=1 Tax=Flavivirga jejuensis TaxID=870487 RepID=A0ABT8WT81_9FLAO|nr:hypothetical protein [Flavivirga jejuensis]MDO5976382.1 hypothetical protein [Flavivirga jejuensis]